MQGFSRSGTDPGQGLIEKPEFIEGLSVPCDFIDARSVDQGFFPFHFSAPNAHLQFTAFSSASATDQRLRPSQISLRLPKAPISPFIRRKQSGHNLLSPMSLTHRADANSNPQAWALSPLILTSSVPDFPLTLKTTRRTSLPTPDRPLTVAILVHRRRGQEVAWQALAERHFPIANCVCWPQPRSLAKPSAGTGRP